MRYQPLSLFAVVFLCSAYGSAQQVTAPEVPLDPERAAALEAYIASGEDERFVSQEDHPANLRGPAVPYGLGFCDDVLVGVGPRYTVTFDGGSFEMQQRGGRDSGAHALSFTLEDIRRGDDVLYSASHGAGRPVQDGFTASVELTPAIDARFEVGANGIEQSFMFHELPGTSGDLVVRGRIDTDMERLDAHSGPEGLVYERRSDDEPFRLRYGGVTGIDAVGRRSKGALFLQDGMLELRLPASFMENAVAPILLDPLVGPMDQSFPTGPYYDPADAAVAFDQTNQRYLAVWTEAGYYARRYIYGQFRSTSGAPIGGLIPILFGNSHVRSVELANVNATNKFLLVYVDSAYLYARSIDAGSGQISSPLYLDSVSWWNYARASFDVGGEALPPYDKALVVYTGENWWNDEDVLVHKLVSCPASGPPISHSTDAGTVVRLSAPHISVSKSGGNSGNWMVSWDDRIFLGQIDIRVALFDYSGSKSGIKVMVANAGYINSIAVAGDGSTYAAAAGLGSNIRARTYFGTVSNGGLHEWRPMTTVNAYAGNSSRLDLERAGDYYLAAWGNVLWVPGNPIHLIEGCRLTVSECAPAELIYTMSEATNGEQHSRIRLFSEKSASPLGTIAKKAMLISSTVNVANYGYNITGSVISE